MTLYRHFESKDQLVAEYLKCLNDYGRERFMEAIRAHPGDAYEQLRAYVERVGEDLSQAGVRGCPMANAAVELPEKNHPARIVIEECKIEHRGALAKLCREAGFVEAERLADELFLLFEGACVDVQISGATGPGSRFARVANALIASHERRAVAPAA
jgi:AcrR family transcriptional regulator